VNGEIEALLHQIDDALAHLQLEARNQRRPVILKIVEIDAVLDPERLSRLDLAVLND
jgi:hypothetical protein